MRVAAMQTVYVDRCLSSSVQLCSMGLYHALDGDTNLKYKLLYFITPNKQKDFKEKGTSF
jgi:hypothetical protein